MFVIHVTGACRADEDLNAVKRKILLVEDNATLAEGVRWILHTEGCDVTVVHSGREVIGMIGYIRPEAVVLDVSLPDVDGITVGDAIRRAWPQLPIIFTTGHGDYPGLRNALLSPHTAMLQKPYEIQALIGALDRIMRI